MKKIFYCLLLFFCNILYCQNEKDYQILKEIKIDLFNLKEKDSIQLKIEILNFKNQEEIFDKTFFNNYRYPVLGVDSLKIDELYKTLDFEFLKFNKRKIKKNWCIKRFKDKRIFEHHPKSDPIGLVRFQKIYSISLPVFSKDKKYIFIYYEHFCGSECGYRGIKIYKKNKKKWIYYSQLPISMS